MKAGSVTGQGSIRRCVIALGVVLGAIAAGVLLPGPGAIANLGGGAQVIPVVSAISSEASESNEDGSVLLGAAPDGAPGEAWAFRRVRGSNTPPVYDGAEVPFAENQTSAYSQPVFFRYTDADGWRAAATPLDAAGKPVAQFTKAFYSSATVTPKAGGIMIASTPAIRGGAAVVRQPGGAWKIQQPSSGLLGSSTLADDASNRAPATAFDDSGTTKAFATAIGSSVERVLHFDGTAWSAETVELPSGSSARFEVVAIEATSGDNAWLIAKLDPALGRGVALFRRDVSGPQPTWREVDLGGSLLAQSATPSEQVTDLRPLLQSTATGPVGVDPLTVTNDGVWVDGKLTLSGKSESFTAYYDISDQAIAGTWCEDHNGRSPCDYGFPASFARVAGYRSTAWNGDGFGSRVITAALDHDGDLASNRGTFLSLSGTSFERVPGIGDSDRATSAFSSATRGWLSTNALITNRPRAKGLVSWSVGTRSPFTDITGQPGSPPASKSSQALAVGINGGIARYESQSGWSTEFLLSSTGLVRRPNLRGVAWPEAGRAHAVGDDGEMWLWRGETGLWERDPGAPLGFTEQMTDVAFNPSDPSDGYAIGRNGTLLHYGKAWTRVCFEINQPADPECDDDVQGQRLPFDRNLARNFNFMQIAYSGGEPIVIGNVTQAGGNSFKPVVLVHRAGRWQLDLNAMNVLDRQHTLSPDMALLTVSGLADGGAFIGGSNIAIKRESSADSWRGVKQPLPALHVIASALHREAGELRATVSVSRSVQYSPLPSDPAVIPGVPQPLLSPLVGSGEGALLSQTDTGWRDLTESSYISTKGADIDRPMQPPAVQALLATAGGDAWAVGGITGYSGAGGLSGYDRSSSSSTRARISTSYIGRYSPTESGEAAGQAVAAPVPQSAQTANFIVGANAACAVSDCHDFANGGIAPDVQLAAALGSAARMSQQPGGPRFFMYAGGRRPDDADSAATSSQLARLAALLGQQPSLPVFATPSAGDSVGGNTDAWQSVFSGFNAPLGSGPAPTGITPQGSSAVGGANTHYAFDSQGTGGRIRVIVIDNSRGSLAASDPYQRPAVASQFDWLRDQLRAAKGAQTPAIVIGNRDLNQLFTPQINVATDAKLVATMLRDEGASAYFFDRPEENRTYPIPAGESDIANTIPSFGTGALGYRSESSSSTTGPSSFFGDIGMLLAQVDVAKRDQVTNRAPVSVRMIPLVANLNIEAIDGTLLRRSRPALFSGLAQRPPAGDRWGLQQAPAGSDPYTIFPTPVCRLTACNTRISPEYTFSSSDPDIADFVATDPQSSNLRKPMIGATGKPVSDATSGLLCAYNAGTTTVTISAGGQSFSRRVTVQAGSAQPPCGTVPLSAKRFPQPQPAAPPPAPPAAAPISPQINLVPPPPPTPIPPPTPSPPLVVDPFLIPPISTTTVPTIPPPPPPTLARPIPPTGGMARAPEKQREEEVATEDSQAFVSYKHDELPNFVWTLGGLILMSALIGSTLPGTRRGRGGRRAVPVSNRYHQNPSNTSHRRNL